MGDREWGMLIADIPGDSRCVAQVTVLSAFVVTWTAIQTECLWSMRSYCEWWLVRNRLQGSSRCGSKKRDRRKLQGIACFRP